MTINNFTFFSPTGTEFPVSSNADAKLYTMLTGMELNTFRRKDWSEPVDTALNRQYTNTSLIVGGRYFELEGETVELQASSDNFVHANIDLTNTSAPVSISVEASDNSNATDINNSTGVLKQCFDIVTTDSMGVTTERTPKQTTKLDDVVSPSGKVYGVTTNNGWYEEKLSDNYYRWTRLFSLRANIALASGQLYQSDALSIPALPTGVAESIRTVTISVAPWACWTAYNPTAGGFRMYSTVARSAGKVTFEAVVYGSKN